MSHPPLEQLCSAVHMDLSENVVPLNPLLCHDFPYQIAILWDSMGISHFQTNLQKHVGANQHVILGFPPTQVWCFQKSSPIHTRHARMDPTMHWPASILHPTQPPVAPWTDRRSLNSDHPAVPVASVFCRWWMVGHSGNIEWNVTWCVCVCEICLEICYNFCRCSPI